MKKLTLDYIKEKFAEEGYKLLTTEYKDSKQKLEYICPNGHAGSITWGNWSRGTRCKECYFENKRIPLSYMKRQVEYEDYIFLGEVESKYGQRKFSYKCPNGHYGVMLWNDWKHNHRCPECRGNKPLIIEFIRKQFENEGYTLLTQNYKNNSQKLEYICPRGHKDTISWSQWSQGRRCRECSIENRRTPIRYIEEEFQKEGYTLLTKEYKNSNQKLKYICPNGHYGTIRWNSWSQGHRCVKCAHESVRLSIDFIKEQFEYEGYTLLTKKYKNIFQALSYICPNGHRATMSWSNWSLGHRCPVCSHGISTPENELYEHLSSKLTNVIRRDRSVIPPLELDIVIPDKKLAIEYCGLYWHSEQKGKDKNYHLSKLERCNDVGYRLITIFEDEWLNYKEVIFSRLDNILGISSRNKIYARQCMVKEVSTGEASDFCVANHLQGYHKSKVRFGLYHDNNLVSIMTFDTPNIAKGGINNSVNNIWELNRFCSDKNYRVVGAASKLLTHFTREYKPKQVFSYADRRWSDGGLYEKLGFELVGNSNTNYWYIIGTKRIHRFSFRKSVLKAKLEKFDATISEYKNMLLNSYDRIWDCGNKKYMWIGE